MGFVGVWGFVSSEAARATELGVQRKGGATYLVRLERLGIDVQHAAVGRHAVARAQHYDVARHEFGGCSTHGCTPQQAHGSVQERFPALPSPHKTGYAIETRSF